MVEETVGTGPLPRQHFSTTPVLLTSALGLCPVAETACPPVDERGWEAAHPAGMIDEAEGHRAHLLDHLAELDAGLEPAPHEHARRPRAASGPAGSGRR